MYNVDKYLEDLENRIDAEQEERLYKEWVDFSDGKCEDEFFCPAREKTAPPSIEWPSININDAIEDDDLMLINQFSMCSDALKNGNGTLMSVRSNYGVGIIPSLFGAEKFVMPGEMNTLPNVKPLKSGVEGIKRIVEEVIPDVKSGLGENVFRIGEKYMNIRKKYPKIAKYIRIDHPDCQGPMDICELLWGSDIFVDLFDKPELVHGLLRKVTDTYKEFVDYWFSIVPPADEYHAFFGSLHKGFITIRDDSAMNLSPDMFEEFILPYDDELLKYFNGGAIHFCGRGDHFVPLMHRMKKLYAINLSQPHLNNMEKVFANTIDKGICIIGLDYNAVIHAVENDRKLHGFVNTGR